MEDPVADSMQSGDEALQDLMQRTGVMDRSDTSLAPFAQWTFAEGPMDVDSDISKACATQLEFLRLFKKNWRPNFPEKFSFPDEWKPVRSNKAEYETINGSLACYEMEVLMKQAGDVFTPLSPAETLARHDDPKSFEPDFLLSSPGHYVNNKEYHYIPPVEKALCLNARHSLEHFKPVVFYQGDERGAEAVISGAFLCTPGCWMRCMPMYRFPIRMMGSTESQLTDFSLLLHVVGSSRDFGVCRDGRLRVSVLNPALVVGVKGPVPWKEGLAHPSSVNRPKDYEEAIQDLATAVQPSLDTHLMNWQLRCEQIPETAPIRPLPWLVMFGIIYDAERIMIVAHVPYTLPQKNSTPGQPTRPRIAYLSCVMDSIPFSSVSTTEESLQQWWINRFSAAYALLSLQRHAFRLVSLWESVVWPAPIALEEAALEREHLGPTPTTSEHGDAFPQHEIEFEEEPISAAEQQEELDLAIQARETRAKEILPNLVEWVRNVEGARVV